MGPPLGVGRWFGVEVTRRGKRQVGHEYPSLNTVVANDYLEVMVLPKHLCFNLTPETVAWMDKHLAATLDEVTELSPSSVERC